MKVVITGHLGFIGTHLRKHLEGQGIDIKEGNDILDCPLPPADVVIHLAAQAGVVESVNDPVGTITTNVTGTVRLLREYKDARFIFASTGGAIQETIASPYGLSKYCAEEFIKLLHTNYVILRFANVYGPNSRSVIDKFINEDITIYGDGSATRTYVHVDDLLRGIIDSIKWPVGSYYFGSNENYTVQELAEATGKPIRHTDWRPGELKHSSLKNTTPNWKPEINAINYIKTLCRVS